MTDLLLKEIAGALISLFFTLYSMVGGVSEFVNFDDRSLNNSRGQQVLGTVECSDWRLAESTWICDGHPIIKLGRGYTVNAAIATMNAYFNGTLTQYGALGPLRIVNHEMAHAYDLMDDSVFNGSPNHHGPINIGSDHCRSNRIEFYACEVVRTHQP